MPVLELNMQPGDKVFAESGQLSWMSMAIQMMSSTSAGGQQGGFMGALGRVVAGGTLFMTELTAGSVWSALSFAGKLPCEMLCVDVTPGLGCLAHLPGFMDSTAGVMFSFGLHVLLETAF